MKKVHWRKTAKVCPECQDTCWNEFEQYSMLIVRMMCADCEIKKPEWPPKVI